MIYLIANNCNQIYIKKKGTNLYLFRHLKKTSNKLKLNKFLILKFQ